MSTLWLKGIALVAMTADHLGLVLGGEGWDLLPFDASYLRGMGRIAFPLFAFCLAQGWQKTHDRKRYACHLTAGAIASQIPFSMAFCAPNLTAVTTGNSLVGFSGIYLFFAATAVWAYWYFILVKRWEGSLLLVGTAALLPGIRIEINGFWILGGPINVFYTFLMAFFCLYLFEHRYHFPLEKRIALCVAGVVLLLGYGLPADYGSGLLGIVLIVGFALLPGKGQQAAFLVVWSVLLYGVLGGNMENMVCCMAAALGILRYNAAAPCRFRAKKFFYGYYPVHLMVLGFLNVGMRCGWGR